MHNVLFSSLLILTSRFHIITSGSSLVFLFKFGAMAVARLFMPSYDLAVSSCALVRGNLLHPFTPLYRHTHLLVGFRNNWRRKQSTRSCLVLALVARHCQLPTGLLCMGRGFDDEEWAYNNLRTGRGGWGLWCCGGRQGGKDEERGNI